MVKIKKMQPADRGPVYEILQQTDMFTLAEISVAMELIDIYLFNAEQTDYQIVVASREKRIVGYACYGPTPATMGTFDLYWLAVAPDMQGQGIGKRLLDWVEQDIQRQNGRMIVIETSSQEKYNMTQNFYLRRCYELQARIRDFYCPNDDRLIFVKKLVSDMHCAKEIPLTGL